MLHISFLLYRKFLCLGDPLMCSADKVAIQLQKERHQSVKANGVCLFCHISSCVFWFYNLTPCLFFVFSTPGHSSETDSSSGSSVKTLRRTFSLLQSTARSESSAIPAHQIISLVSMTSPRTFRPHRVSTSPAFVEFDMSESGYG